VVHEAVGGLRQIFGTSRGEIVLYPGSGTGAWEASLVNTLDSGDHVLAFVNGMGGTPLIELYVVYNELTRICAGRGITIVRNLIGSYITSLEMAGTSITLLRMDDDLVTLWDAPVRTSALRWRI
jgi:dihydroxyacetone kinase